MHPGHIEGATRVLAPPRGWKKAEQGPCSRLSIRDVDTTAGNAMMSAWFPTLEELALLVSGAPVYLEIVGDLHPPVFVGVGKPPEAMNPIEEFNRIVKGGS